MLFATLSSDPAVPGGGLFALGALRRSRPGGWAAGGAADTPRKAFARCLGGRILGEVLILYLKRLTQSLTLNLNFEGLEAPSNISFLRKIVTNYDVASEKCYMDESSTEAFGSDFGTETCDSCTNNSPQSI